MLSAIVHTEAAPQSITLALTPTYSSSSLSAISQILTLDVPLILKYLFLHIINAHLFKSLFGISFTLMFSRENIQNNGILISHFYSFSHRMLCLQQAFCVLEVQTEFQQPGTKNTNIYYVNPMISTRILFRSWSLFEGALT